MAWAQDELGDLRGRVAVVTGANGGLGLETSKALARAGARVVMAARDQGKAERARRAITAEAPGATIDLWPLDLASLDAVRACGDGIAEAYPRVDVLVNNAGLMGVPEGRTDDGFERQLGVNHLGHFVLTKRLLASLLGAEAARVVSVTSVARLIGRPVDPDNPHLRGRYGPWRAYGQAKLANLHFAVELQRRLEAAGAPVASLAAHPGVSPTDLQARGVRETAGGRSQRLWKAAASGFGMAPARAAGPQLRAATDPRAKSGDYYAPRWGWFGAPVGRARPFRWLDRDAPRLLWEVSERETGDRFDIGGS